MWRRELGERSGYNTSVISNQATRFGRVSAILSVLSCSEPIGLRLSEIVHEVGMPKTTVFRLVDELVEAGFVSFDRGSNSYHLGDSIDVLARRGSSRFELGRRMRPLLEQLVSELGDTAYFMVVRDGWIVCTERVVGSYPIQSITLDIGDVRPMAVGSSGAAVAGCLGVDDFETLLAEQESARVDLSIDDESLRSIVNRARRDGFSFNPATIVPGMSGIGVALTNGSGTPIGAISVVAVNARFSDGRKEFIAQRLASVRDEAQESLGALL